MSKDVTIDGLVYPNGDAYAFHNASKKTAISRRQPSRPMQWLEKKGLLHGDMLDYGCGRGYDADHFGMVKYDPNWCSFAENCDATGTPRRYDVITCNYVFNVLPHAQCLNILDHMRFLLKEGGDIYITVRRDIIRPGWNRNSNTFQRNVSFEDRDEVTSLFKHQAYEIFNAKKRLTLFDY